MRCNVGFARKCTSLSDIAAEEVQSTYLLNHLVQTYGNLGCIQQAWEVFSSIPHEQRNKFSWNIMLAAFAKNGHLEHVKSLFHQMPRRDVVSWNSYLNALVHNAELSSASCCFYRMPQTNVFSWNSIMFAFALNGDLLQAAKLFQEIPERNLDSWNAFLRGHAQNGDVLAAVNIFQRMESRNLISWTEILTSYAKNGELQHAKSILKKMPSWDSICWNVMISGMLQNGEIDGVESIFLSLPHRNILSWNSMIQIREIEKSEEVFQKMPQWNSFSWNSMLTAYAENGQLEAVEKLFAEIPSPNTVSWNLMLQAYSLAGEADQAKILFESMPERDIITWNSLLAAFAQRERTTFAENFFDLIPLHNSISCNTMLAAFSDQGRAWDAKLLFDRMRFKDPVSWNTMIQLKPENAGEFFGKIPWRTTFSCAVMIQACGELGDFGQANQIFESTEAVHRDLIVWNSMISTMCQLGKLEYAREIFQRAPTRNSQTYITLIQAFILRARVDEAKSLLSWLPEQSPISCSTVLNACVQIGELDEAGVIFRTLLRNKSDSTWNLMLRACIQGGELEQSRELFDRMPHRDELSWNLIMSGYSQAGNAAQVLELFNGLPFEPGVLYWNILLAVNSRDMETISKLFREMPARDTVSWNTIISAFARSSESSYQRAALKLFREMDLEGDAAPNESTLVGVLEACSGLTALPEGSTIHHCLIEAGIPYENHPSVGTALLSMYGRCGRVAEAELVFSTLRRHDPISWTSMIGIYCSNGLPGRALDHLWLMEQSGFVADRVTFVEVLSGCSHAGMFQRGLEIFLSMVESHGVDRCIEHYGCMVDLLARAGHLELAEDLSGKMKTQNVPSLTTLLAACGSHSDPDRAARLSSLAPEASSASRYILLSNVHATM